jgi:hypothetical protein
VFAAVVAFLTLGSALFAVAWLVDPYHQAAPPSDSFTIRFPEDRDTHSTRLSHDQVVLLRALTGTGRPTSLAFEPMQMSSAEFLAAMAAVDARTRPPARPNAVFNDAQIVSIKERLRLTADQEEHWPAMEEALRDITWERTGRNGAVLNPDSLQRLHVVATAFVARLNERQKREVKTLANVAGLPINFNGR